VQGRGYSLGEFIKIYFQQSGALIGNKSRLRILGIRYNTAECLYILKLKNLSRTDQEIISLLLADLILEIVKSNGEAIEIMDLKFANGELVTKIKTYGILGLRAIDAINFVLVRELKNLIVDG